jgi:transcription-repair coupling factor (superfamily II helicase)
MEEELKDRYGIIPEPLRNLLKIISLKCFLIKAKIRRLEHSAKQIIVHVTDYTPINMKRILKLVKEDQDKIKLLPDGKIIMQTDKKAKELISLTRNILMDIISI